MNDSIWHTAFRRTGRQSIITNDPFDAFSGIGIEVEHFACDASHNRRYVCLIETRDTAMVVRKEVAYRVASGRVKSVPLWEGQLRCSSRFVRSQIAGLSRLGLWELNDFISDRDALDGEYYVVRAADTVEDKQNAFVLFCPDESDDVRYRAIARRLERLLAMGRKAYLFRSWMSAIFRC